MNEAGADQPLNVAKNEVDELGENKREGQKLERPRSVRTSTAVRWHDGKPEEEPPRKEKELNDGV